MSRGKQLWQVGPDGPRTLGEVLEALGVDARALAEGRVFVERRRASDATEELDVGSRVEVFAARPSEEPAWVVERADGFVIAHKPAALPTEADRSGHACLSREIAALIGARQVHAVSRLDVGVSGLVLLSESRTAHQRAARLREQGAISRAYVAIAERAPAPEHGGVSTPVEGRAAHERSPIRFARRMQVLRFEFLQDEVVDALLCPSSVTNRRKRRVAQGLVRPELPRLVPVDLGPRLRRWFAVGR